MTGPRPTIVGFLCTWCAYAAADRAGAIQRPYPPNLHVIRVPCSGRVAPSHVLRAFAEGADGVVIMACHQGDCHYKEGNLRAAQRHRVLIRLLAELGVEPERCRLAYVAASESDGFVREIEDAVAALEDLAPLSSAPGRRLDRHA